MTGSEQFIALLIEIACGAAGGLAVGGLFPRLSLGSAFNATTGATGGLLLTWLAGFVPGVARFVGQVENAAEATARGVGVLTPAVLAGVGIAGLLGGVMLTAAAGLLVNRGGN